MGDRATLQIRALGPEHRALLADGFRRLSARSRYHRFFTPKPHLTAGELRFLTRPDGLDHCALGAAIEHADGAWVGVGVARYVRAHDDPRVAHVAVTVADEAQGFGLGSGLLRRLAYVAGLRGIERFRFTVLPENVVVRTLLASRRVPMTVEGTLLQAEWRTPEVARLRTRRDTRALLEHLG